MPEQKIYILTAPIQSGKTTSLIQWAEKRNDVSGICTPVINNKRMFMDIAGGYTFTMEADVEEKDILLVGRFQFSCKNFNNAIQIIKDAIQKPGWLIIDEIGPLELKGEGFSDVLKEVLVKRQDKTFIVIREKDDMVNKVREHFGINNAVIIRSITQITE